MQKSIPSSAERIGRITTDKNLHYDINAICNNCSKRCKSTRALAMHLKMTGARHTVNILDHGKYNKNIGMRNVHF